MHTSAAVYSAFYPHTLACAAAHEVVRTVVGAIACVAHGVPVCVSKVQMCGLGIMPPSETHVDMGGVHSSSWNPNVVVVVGVRAHRAR